MAWLFPVSTNPDISRQEGTYYYQYYHYYSFFCSLFTRIQLGDLYLKPEATGMDIFHVLPFLVFWFLYKLGNILL